MEKLHYDEEQIWHDTELFLRKFRTVRYALQLEAEHYLNELHSGFGAVDTFISEAELAGAIIHESPIESRVNSMYQSREMVKMLLKSVSCMRQYHPQGKIYYEIIRLSYLSVEEHSTNDILVCMEEKGMPVSRNTLRKYRKEAIEIIGNALWGYHDRETMLAMCNFAHSFPTGVGRCG